MRMEDMAGWVWTLVIVGIFLGVGLLVLSEFRTSLDPGDQQAAIDNVTLSINNAAKQLPIVGTVIGVALIIGVVAILALYGGRKSGYF